MKLKSGLLKVKKRTIKLGSIILLIITIGSSIFAYKYTKMKEECINLVKKQTSERDSRARRYRIQKKRMRTDPHPLKQKQTRNNASRRRLSSDLHNLVDLEGFEPLTSRMRTERSPN